MRCRMPACPCQPSGLCMRRLTVSRDPCAAHLTRAQPARGVPAGDPTRGEAGADQAQALEVIGPAPPAICLVFALLLTSLAVILLYCRR